MKIGISTGAYSRYGDEMFEKVKGFGYSAVDFLMSNTDADIYTKDLNEVKEYLLHLKKLANDAGVMINQAHGPWRWPPQDYTLENRLERMEKMKRSIQMTSLLGAENFVIHPLEPFGINDLDIGKQNETFEINYEFFMELLTTAKEYGVVICLENMPWGRFSMARPSDILNFVNKINDDNFKACLDTGHVAALKLSAGDSVRLLNKELRVFHIHDSYPDRDMHLLPYCGIIDWADFGAAVKEIGFDGVISLETAPSEKLPQSIFEEMSLTLSKILKSIVE